MKPDSRIIKSRVPGETAGTDCNLSPSTTLETAVAVFVKDSGEITGIGPLGDGNINDTYLVTLKSSPSLVLQRMNSSVFPDPKGVAENTARITRHLQSEISADSEPNAAYRFPESVQTIDQKHWFQDREEEIWRCQAFVENSTSLKRVTAGSQPYEAGRLLGFFHRTLASFDRRTLHIPLPGFHDLKQYRQKYIDAVRVQVRTASAEFDYCRSMVEQRLEIKTLNELAAAAGVELRVIHGDPKFDNFLFDAELKRAVSLIDLDTTAPGLTSVDIGDCLRSFCNPGGEKSTKTVSFDIDMCRKLIEGYQSAMEMTPAEGSLIYHGGRLMIYELGLRFFTDYLENDRYFKVADKEENLRRAVVQFNLLESLEAQRSAVEAIVGFYR